VKAHSKISKLLGILFVNLFALVLASTLVYAVPGNPFPQEMRQADGSVIWLSVGGDESFNWLEDAGGNIILFDTDSGNFTYATIINNQLVPNPDMVAGLPSLVSPFGNSRLTFDDIAHIAAQADNIAPYFYYSTFVERHSLFNRMSINENGDIVFDEGMTGFMLNPIRPEFETQHLFPFLVEFSVPNTNTIGGQQVSRLNMFRDRLHEDANGNPVFNATYGDLPQFDWTNENTTATEFWGRKLFDDTLSTGSVVHYFNEQAFAVRNGLENPPEFFIPAPEMQFMLPSGTANNTVTGTRSMVQTQAQFVRNDIPYTLFFDSEWNIFRITLEMAHPAPSNVSEWTRFLTQFAMDIILYDDYGFDRNPDANIWPRTANTGHTRTNGIPPNVHPYIIVAGHDASGGGGAGLGQVWAHAWSTLTQNTPTFRVGGNTGQDGLNKRWVGRAYASNGEIFNDGVDRIGADNGSPFRVGENEFDFATMSIGVITHELGHTLGIGDTYDTGGNSRSLRPYSLMAHGSWGTVIDQIPGSTPTRLDPLHMIETGMIRPDQIIVVETIEDFEVTLHPFYLSDSFYDNMINPATRTGVFRPGDSVPNPYYNILMIWAPEHREVLHGNWGGGNVSQQRAVPTEFFLLDARFPMGYDRGMTRYGIGMNRDTEQVDPRNPNLNADPPFTHFHHTTTVSSAAMIPHWPDAPALNAFNSGFIIDGGILLYHYDRTASPGSFNPQNANMHHKRADLIPADGSDLLRHAVGAANWNASYGSRYATHDYFVNQDHFFSNDLTRSMLAVPAFHPDGSVIRGDGSAAAYAAYNEAASYARSLERNVRLNRLFNGFWLNDNADPEDPETWTGGTWGRGPETGHSKVESTLAQGPLPATANNNFIFRSGERNTFPTAHFYDRIWPGTGAANINLSRNARTGNVPNGMDLYFPDSRMDALVLNSDGSITSVGMRVKNRIHNVEINVMAGEERHLNHGREFVLRIEQFAPATSGNGSALNNEANRNPIRNHPDSHTEDPYTGIVTIGVTNGHWMIFEIIDGEEVFTGEYVTVFEGLHTPVTFTADPLHATVYAEDWRDTINIRFFLGDDPISIPLEDIVLTVDGVVVDNIRDFTVNIADWQTETSALFISRTQQNWQEMTIEVSAHRQTLTLKFENNMFVPTPTLTFDIFNNGPDGSPSRPNASLAAAGIIRMWSQLDGVNALVPYSDLTITAEFPDGGDAMQFVRVNNIWENPGNVNLIDVRKDGGAWETIILTVGFKGQEIVLILDNALFSPVVFDIVAFNNGTDLQVPGLAGRIRIWPQLDGNSAPIPMNAAMTATDQDGNNVIQFITPNRQWTDAGWANYNVNFDVQKEGANWQTINFSITAHGQTASLELINDRFVQ